jgi:Tfp pilus assembly protein PilZ
MSEQKSGTEKRRYPRSKPPVLYKPAKIIGQKHQVPDISLGGMRIFSNKYYAVGQTLNVELSLPSGQTGASITRVVWVDAYPKDSSAPYELGLEFIYLPFGAARELESVIKDSLSSKQNAGN